MSTNKKRHVKLKNNGLSNMNISGLQFCIFIYSEWKVGGGGWVELGGRGSLSLVVDLCMWGEGEKGESYWDMQTFLEFLSLYNTIIISGG